MNARALQEPSIDPVDAAMLAEDPDDAARGSLAILVTILVMVLGAVAVAVLSTRLARRSRARRAVASLPKKAVDSLSHAVSRLSDVAAS